MNSGSEMRPLDTSKENLLTLFQQTLIIKWEKQPVWENCIPCPSTQSPSKIYLKASTKFFSTSVP